MSNQIMKFCKLCSKPTMHIYPSTSHVLHFFLTVITAGFWLIIWLIAFYNNRSQSQCSICGRESGLFGSSRGGVAQSPAIGEHIKCPDCAELILKEAKKCKHCGCNQLSS